MSWGKFLDQLGVVMRLAALGLLGLAGLCVWDTHRALVQLRLTEQKVADSAIVMGGAAGDLQKTLALERTAAGDQIAATTATLQQAQTDLADVDKAALSLDATLRTVNTAVGTLNGAIEANSGQMIAIEDQAKRDLADFDADEASLQQTMSSANGAVSAANKLLADPTIPDDLVQLHAGLVHVNATSAHVDAATGDLAEAIHRETRPASFAMKTAGFIVDGVSKAGSILAGFIK